MWALLFLILIILTLVYLLFRWQIRGRMMKKLAEDMGLDYIKKLKKNSETNLDLAVAVFQRASFQDDYVRNCISGDYLGHKVLIFERATSLGSGRNEATTKLLTIIIDGQCILSFNYYDVLVPLSKKVRKMVDDYINKGIVPNKKRSEKYLLITFFIVLFCLIVAQIYKMVKY